MQRLHLKENYILQRHWDRHRQVPPQQPKEARNMTLFHRYHWKHPPSSKTNEFVRKQNTPYMAKSCPVLEKIHTRTCLEARLSSPDGWLHTRGKPTNTQAGPEVYKMARTQIVQILWTSQLLQCLRFSSISQMLGMSMVVGHKSESYIIFTCLLIFPQPFISMKSCLGTQVWHMHVIDSLRSIL